MIKYMFSYDASTAIPIYVQNIIKALNTLDDVEKPLIYLLHNDSAPVEDILSIGYPHVRLVKSSYFGPLWQRAINRLCRYFFNGNYMFLHGICKYNIDCIFPHFGRIDNALISRTAAWITDFQPHYYPAFFPKDDLTRILDNLAWISKSKCKLVLSSGAAYNDYVKFYPNNNNKIITLRFVSIPPEVSETDWHIVKGKFKINKPYFVVSNQFWPHKNHLNLIKALSIVKQIINVDELPFDLLITGKTSTHRNPKIFEELEQEVQRLGLAESIRFLGFLERTDQIQIIKNAYAVIQPSFFEGWSTLVEECKALSKFIILSDIPVHREQMERNVVFFNPNSPEDLADNIVNIMELGSPHIIPFNYSEHVHAYAKDILNLLK